jgi:hypothetical protein
MRFLGPSPTWKAADLLRHVEVVASGADVGKRSLRLTEMKAGICVSIVWTIDAYRRQQGCFDPTETHYGGRY